MTLEAATPAPINISGASVSADGGSTFTRLTRANGQSAFDNTLGDPVILYNPPTGHLVHAVARRRLGRSGSRRV
jgi:hypothetical protein